MAGNYNNHAIEIFNAAVASVQPAELLPQYIQSTNDAIVICNQTIRKTAINKLKIIAAGKAAASMAQTAESIFGNFISEGLCITKYHHTLPLRYCKIMESAHPFPDLNSIIAADEVLKMALNSHENDIVLVLLSGGASSLMADVPDGCTLTEIQTAFDLLVNSGASIHEINGVRKHLSNIKGGRLAAAAAPATIFTLILSDVVGNHADAIASGPTVADTTTYLDALLVIQRHRLTEEIPASILNHLQRGQNGELAETPKPGDPLFEKCFSAIIGSNSIAVNAAKEKAASLGYHTVIYKHDVTDAVDVQAKEMLEAAVMYTGNIPACFIAGGETTVKLNGITGGKGGRNQHFVLTALNELGKISAPYHITILSGATDGTDGPTDAAGAIAGTDNIHSSNNPGHYLQFFDSYHYFEKNGGLLQTGPTNTNVMDIMLILIN